MGTKISEMPQIHIQAFSVQFADDITQLYRRNFVSSSAILLQAVKAPLFYITVALGTGVFKFICGDTVVAIILSVISAGMVVIFTVYGIVFFQERFNGNIYPRKLSKINGGVFLLAIDKATPKLAGSIAIESSSKDEAWLNMACVAQEYRGRGTFQKLFKSAINHCSDKGFKLIKTHVWDVSIPFFSMIPIFKRRGFVVTETYYAPSRVVPLLKAYTLEKRLLD